MARRQTTSPTLPPSLAGDLWFAMHRTGLGFSRLIFDRLQPLGVDPRHYLVLTCLDEGGPSTQAQLTATIGIDRTSIVYVIDELERQELAQRQRSTTDRRAYAVGITEAGRSRLAELRAVVDQVRAEVLAPLNDAERHQLHTLLARLATPSS